jgi:hypothetical protein
VEKEPPLAADAYRFYATINDIQSAKQSHLVSKGKLVVDAFDALEAPVMLLMRQMMRICGSCGFDFAQSLSCVVQ